MPQAKRHPPHQLLIHLETEIQQHSIVLQRRAVSPIHSKYEKGKYTTDSYFILTWPRLAAYVTFFSKQDGLHVGLFILPFFFFFILQEKILKTYHSIWQT